MAIELKTSRYNWLSKAVAWLSGKDGEIRIENKIKLNEEQCLELLDIAKHYEDMSDKLADLEGLSIDEILEHDSFQFIAELNMRYVLQCRWEESVVCSKEDLASCYHYLYSDIKGFLSGLEYPNF